MVITNIDFSFLGKTGCVRQGEFGECPAAQDKKDFWQKTNNEKFEG